MVLDKFGSSLKSTFKKIAGMGIVDKEAVEEILRELQRTLIASDVDVALVAQLTSSIKKKVLGEKVSPGMTLKEVFIKTLYDEVVSFLGAEKGEIGVKKQKILVIGLFGSGKTTTIGKMAKWFKVRGLNPALVACDIHRPAAQTQLQQIGDKVGAKVYREGKKAEDVAKKALKEAKEDVLIFDSAGRDALDEELAKELKNMGNIIQPDEVLLVIPADIGQAAGRQAEEFNKLVGITGLAVSKLDGTARGGGALAAASAAGAPVKFIGVGEKMGDLEMYDPKRFVSRLIGYGDIQGLLDKAKEAGIKEDGVKKMLEGRFTLNEFMEQIQNMKKMGPLNKITEMMPGMGSLKIPKGMLDVQEEKMKKWEHIISSMTPKEKEEPDILTASRIGRIAGGSGTAETEVRELMKNYKQIKKVMRMTKGGKAFKRGPFAKLAKQMGMG